MAGQPPNFDWTIVSRLLDSSSSMPGDVKFQVVNHNGQLVAVVEAHKIILALHCDHFKNTFFGSGLFFKEKQEGVVVIKDTTKEAFEDFVAFTYEKRVEFEKKSLSELYEILNLAERYQVRELKDKVVSFIKNFHISIDNVAKVAETTYAFSQFHEESQTLYSSCLTFLRAHFSDVQSVFSFVKNCDDQVTVVRLLKDLDITDKKCGNCQQSPCRNQSDVYPGDLLQPGTMIKTKANDDWRQKYRCQRCQVMMQNDNKTNTNDTSTMMQNETNTNDANDNYDYAKRDKSQTNISGGKQYRRQGHCKLAITTHTWRC